MDRPYLEIRNAQGRRELPLDDQPLTIGRSTQNRLAIVDGLTSRFHCVVEKVPSGWRIRDLGSRNGTRLNGEIVKSGLIMDGDVVTVGQTSMRMVVPAPAGARRGPKVEAEPEPDVKVDDTDYQAVLQRRADALPEKAPEETEINLVNARGQITHPGAAAVGMTPETRREAVGILRLLLLICFRSHATDIHIEPKSEDYTVRIRVDGAMVDACRVDKQMGTRLTSIVKILCDIDIGQRNIIQEGHFSVRLPDRRVDYRVSFAPAVFGQKLVVRILDTANAPMYVWDLQMPEWMLEEIQRAIQLETGMVLVCGPTGSGKTTTLYSAVRSIDTSERNVVTIEDPVEIQLEGVTQIPVNAEQGNTFPNLLRSVLRQDPDGILVGEIRDAETAHIAMQAAMTGHLVFSTVHARDTVGTVFRLLDLGVEPYLVASGLHVVLAQRLVRQLCPYCKRPAKAPPHHLQKMGKAGEGLGELYVPVGCIRCLGTGYAGRRALFELLSTSDELRDTILGSPTPQDIYNVLAKTPFQRLRDSGYQLVAEGITSFDEMEKSVG